MLYRENRCSPSTISEAVTNKGPIGCFLKFLSDQTSILVQEKMMIQNQNFLDLSLAVLKHRIINLVVIILCFAT